MAAGAGPLSGLLGLPEALLREAGVILLPYAALVGFLAFRRAMSVPAVWAVAACNAVWAVDSVVLLMTGWVSPTLLGTAFTLAQALVVAGFAALHTLQKERVVLSVRDLEKCRDRRFQIRNQLCMDNLRTPLTVAGRKRVTVRP